MKTIVYISQIVAMYLSRTGYNPHKAAIECSNAGGFIIYDKGNLNNLGYDERWKTYAFNDGSSVDIAKAHMITKSGIPEGVAVDPLFKLVDLANAQKTTLTKPDRPTVH